MSAFNLLAQEYLAPEVETSVLKRIGSAILGRGMFGSLPYRNLLRVGSTSSGLILDPGKRQLLIPWSVVVASKAPWGIFPKENG